ncbi:unnamed protein product, partial [Porites lobata]
TALSVCFGFGGDLVSISDEKELDFVYKLSFKDTSDPVWIGLAYWFQKSTYFWSNGTSFNNSVSQSWFGSIPSNVSENKCVEISRNGSNITDCCKKNPRFICERAKGPLACSADGFLNGLSCYKENNKDTWTGAKQECIDS